MGRKLEAPSQIAVEKGLGEAGALVFVWMVIGLLATSPEGDALSTAYVRPVRTYSAVLKRYRSLIRIGNIDRHNDKRKLIKLATFTSQSRHISGA